MSEHEEDVKGKKYDEETEEEVPVTADEPVDGGEPEPGH